MAPPRKPTPEQAQVIQTDLEAGQVMVINAIAGSGKTSTLQMYVDAYPNKKFLYLAFRKARRVSHHSLTRISRDGNSLRAKQGERARVRTSKQGGHGTAHYHAALDGAHDHCNCVKVSPIGGSRDRHFTSARARTVQAGGGPSYRPKKSTDPLAQNV